MAKDIIDQYNQVLFETYNREGLLSLEDNDFIYKGINVLELPSNPEYEEEKFQPSIVLWDIISCSKDLKYATGQLYLHRDLINNPMTELMEFPKGQLLSTYYQNLYDRRYSSYVTICFEKSYNFWDRLGDVIASFFPTLLRIHEVDFNRIIARLKDSGIDNESLSWLIEFKEGDYRTLNSYRKDFVHYNQFESLYRYNHAINAGDMASIQQLWEEKEGFADYFKNLLEQSREGFYHTFQFLSSLR